MAMMTTEEINAAAKLYAERFTKEWLRDSVNMLWTIEADDWFFNNYLKKEDSGYTFMSTAFHTELKKLWKEKYNEYFGKETDLGTLRGILFELDDMYKEFTRVFGNQNFDIDKETLSMFPNLMERINKIILQNEE